MAKFFARGSRFALIAGRYGTSAVAVSLSDKLNVANLFCITPLQLSNGNVLCKAYNMGILYFGARVPPYWDVGGTYGWWTAGYTFRLTNNQIQVWKGDTQLGTGSSYTTGGDLYVRLSLDGSTLKVKSWAASGSEPNWVLQVTDSTYASGNLGVSGSAGTVYVYWLGVGTDGDAPPSAGSVVNITGTVTRGGTPVPGAKVIAVRYDAPGTAHLSPMSDFAMAVTDSNGNYSISIDCSGPWVICASAIISGVYYASDARLVYLG